MKDNLEEKKKKLIKEVETLRKDMKGLDVIKSLMKKDHFEKMIKKRKNKELSEEEKILDFLCRLKNEFKGGEE